jgi:hypothetical protein
MKIPKRLINWQSNSDNSLLLNIDNCYCKIYLLTDDIIRIRTSFNNDFLEESYVLTTTAWDDRFDELHPQKSGAPRGNLLSYHLIWTFKPKFLSRSSI